MDDRHETRIEINGVVYRSLDEVPAEFRSHLSGLLADDDGDGVPDIAQNSAMSAELTHRGRGTRWTA